MANRERRSNAGNRMGKLIDDEEDEFYKTTYGGFEEAAEDNDYVEEGDGGDIVDSDFSIDEDDELKSDNEEETAKKRKRGTFTKAYKEPAKSKPTILKKKSNVSVTKPKASRPEKTVVEGGRKAPAIERKSIRKSTAVKSAETRHRVKIRSELQKKKVKKSKHGEWIPTQEELLAEAAITAEENLQSLERFEQSELEKKKFRPMKKAVVGPIIRYHSFSVPLIIEIDEKKNRSKPEKLDADTDIEMKPAAATETIVKPDKEEVPSNEKTETEDAAPKTAAVEKMDTTESINETGIKLEDKQVAESKEKPKSHSLSENKSKKESGDRYERTLLTFENDINDVAFKAAFPDPPVRRKRHSRICAVTKRPASYFDPVTRLPYSDLMAFRILREAYYQLLETRGDRNNPEVAEWVKWRLANKNTKVKATT